LHEKSANLTNGVDEKKIEFERQQNEENHNKVWTYHVDG
jgi:hypothetical protein